MPIQRIFPKPEDGKASYVGSMNVDIVDGKLVPAFDHGRITGETDFVHYVVATIEYKSPTSFNPRHYIFVNKSCYRYEDGALTLDGTFTDVVQGAVLCDNGATPGVPIIVAFFGSSTTVNGHYWRDTTTDTTPWTLNSGATKTQGWLATTFGAKVAIVTGKNGAGRTGSASADVIEHLVGSVAAGTDPRIATNVAAAEPVGATADYPITCLLPIRDTVIAGRADGFFYRNDTSKQWEPVRALMDRLPHGLNGKGAWKGENGIFLPCNDGQVFFYDGENTSISTPYHGETIAKDALRGRISAGADIGRQVVMVEATAHTYLDGPQAAAAGVRFFTKIAGVEAEITAGVTDGSYATPVVANMNAWGGAAADKLYAVSPFPLEGLILFTTRQSNSTAGTPVANKFATPEVSDGGAGTYTSLGNVIDFTRLSLSTSSLALTGIPPAASEPFLGWDAINGFDLATKVATITLASQAMTNVYVYRFSPSNTTPFSVTATIDEIGVIEARAGLPVADGTASKDLTHRDRAGLLTRIHVADRVGTQALRNWRTVYALDTHGGVQVVSWTTAATGALSNGGYGLLVLGRERQFVIAEGITRDPTRTPRARVTQYTTTEAGPLAAIRNVAFTDGNRGVDPRRPKTIKAYYVDGNYIQPGDIIRAICELDNGRAAFEFKAGGGSPLELRNSDAGRCRKADHWFCLEDTTQGDPNVMEIVSIDMEWDYAEGGLPTDPPYETKAVS